MRRPVAPRARAASTYSSRVVCRTTARTSSAAPPQPVMPTRTDTSRNACAAGRPSGRAARTASSRKIHGTASEASMTSESHPSSHAPTYPPRPPTTTAMSRVMEVATTAAASDRRVPCSTRASTSRPRSSVPNGNAALGASAACSRYCRSGGWRLAHPAATIGTWASSTTSQITRRRLTCAVSGRPGTARHRSSRSRSRRARRTRTRRRARPGCRGRARPPPSAARAQAT